jgi:glucose/arabinose dehydrogenase
VFPSQRLQLTISNKINKPRGEEVMNKNQLRGFFVSPSAIRTITLITCLAIIACATINIRAVPQATGPSLVDPALSVRTAISGLTTPIGLAFIGTNDMLVIEKDTGRVQRVVNGVVQSTVLDLAVNFASERGLLGIALHPAFPSNPRVYLYWTCRTAGPPVDPFVPDERECPDTPALGEDTDDVLAVPLLANRVDRFIWNGSTLTFDRNIIKLLAFQNDGAPTPPNQGDQNQPPRGNHDGGVIRFGFDGKLYIIVGDVGRRSQLQNLPSGPTLTGLGPTVADDQFGGPRPDDAHFTGVILRLNDDGTTPRDNPFVEAVANGGQTEEADNIRKIYAYGIRNSFGMAFDPLFGNLWYQENGEDAFDEINRVERGMNSGWIQFMGPASRIQEYKAIETTNIDQEGFPNLQQFRWPPSRIANTTAQGLARLFNISGSVYSDPEFSWRWVLAPAGIGFLNSSALGAQYNGDLFVGFSTPSPLGGPLFRFRLTADRAGFTFSDSRLNDLVADNNASRDMTESESLVFGSNFGIVTDIQTGPNGNLFIVSLADGVIYEIFRP